MKKNVLRFVLVENIEYRTKLLTQVGYLLEFGYIPSVIPV
jgi:hypothetical protein